MLGIAIGVLLVGGILAGPVMSNVETPSYEVLQKFEDIEIRKYDPLIIAKVEIEGERKNATGDGFRLLADYIFGNNQSQNEIAMTAPVEQQASQKIAMTAPVEQMQVNDSWQISFVMPSEYAMETLPKPNNSNVILKEQEAKTYAVIRFSGQNEDENVQSHKQKLIAFMDEKQLEPISAPKYAFYNPPWTLPMMRRNEVMIEIRAADF